MLKLFLRIKEVYENKTKLESPEDCRLLGITYNDFIRNGAGLNGNEKDKLREVDKELSTLSPQFSKNTLNATNEFELWLEDEDLQGLPESVVDAAK